MALPILYSLQYCPYAMRARLGIALARQTVRLRAIVLKNKPQEMLDASAKGTVPVLVIENRDGGEDRVIDESLDIMLWALKQSDPDNLLRSDRPQMLAEMLGLISVFDTNFRANLAKYKSAKRYHIPDKEDHRQACEVHIRQLEQRLDQHSYLMGNQPSLIDYAVFPYVRQFAKIERQWFLNTPYPRLKLWLRAQLDSPLYAKVMARHPLWLDNHEEVLFIDG